MPTVAPIPFLKPHWHDNNGNVATGYKLYSYDSSTQDEIPLYADPAGTTPYSNPLTLNSRGEPTGTGIYLDTSKVYKIVLKTDTDDVVWTTSSISTAGSNTSTVTSMDDIPQGIDYRKMTTDQVLGLTDGGITELHTHSHDFLENVDPAGPGITEGHITDGTQTIAGAKTFAEMISGPVLNMNGTGTSNFGPGPVIQISPPARNASQLNFFETDVSVHAVVQNNSKIGLQTISSGNPTVVYAPTDQVNPSETIATREWVQGTITDDFIKVDLSNGELTADTTKTLKITNPATTGWVEMKSITGGSTVQIYGTSSAATGVTAKAVDTNARVEVFKGSNAYVALNGSDNPYVLVVDDNTANSVSLNSTGINSASYNGYSYQFMYNSARFQDANSLVELYGASNKWKNKATNKAVNIYCGANDLQNYVEVDYANGSSCRMGGSNYPSFYLFDGTHAMELTTTNMLFDGVPLIKGYNHSQGVASTVWTITHNLGYRPVIQTWDSTGAQIVGTIQHVSINQATVTFATSQSGAGRCV